MSHCEILRDEDGTVLAKLQLAKAPTPDERTAIAEVVKAARSLMPRKTEAGQQKEEPR